MKESQALTSKFIAEINLAINPIVPFRGTATLQNGKVFWESKTKEGGIIKGMSTRALTEFDREIYFAILTYKVENGIIDNTFEIPLTYLLRKKGLKVCEANKQKLFETLFTLFQTGIQIEEFYHPNGERKKESFYLLTSLSYCYKVLKEGKEEERKMGENDNWLPTQEGKYVKKVKVSIPPSINENINLRYLIFGDYRVIEKINKNQVAKRMYYYCLSRCRKNNVHKRNKAAFINDIIPEKPLDQARPLVMQALSLLHQLGVISYHFDLKDNIILQITEEAQKHLDVINMQLEMHNYAVGHQDNRQ